MINFETIEINSKLYISFLETDEEELTIPILDKSKNGYIYGIASMAVIGQEFKKLIIPMGIEDIEENAFLDCPNLEEVYLDNLIYKEINLDKCFLKESKNILFLVKNFPSVINYVSNNYMLMENNDIFNFSTVQYEEDENKIYLTKFPNIIDLYIPDFHKEKEVSLEKISNKYLLNCLELEKLRVPKNGFSRLSEISNLKEVCFSSLSTKIILPITRGIEKIVLYDKVEHFAAPSSPNYNNLKIFTINDSVESLKSFYFPSIETSTWYKNIIPDKNGNIIYEGLLLDVPEYLKKLKYIMPRNVVFMRNHLFEKSDIKQFIFNTKIKNISRSCFYDCQFLKSIFIPKNVKYIAGGAFAETALGIDKDFSKNVIFEDRDKDDKIIIDKEAFELEENFS